MISLASTLRKRSRAASVLAAVLIALGLAPGQSLAQQNDSVSTRISRLEAEVANLKVMVGTLESLLRTTPSATLPQESAGNEEPASSEGDLASRVAALETQIGALTSQIDQIGQQMSGLEARLSALPPATPPMPQAQAPAVPPPSAPPAPQAEAPAVPPPSAPPAPQAEAPAAPPNHAAADAGDVSKPRWYGSKPDTGAASSEAGPRQIVPPGDAATGSIKRGNGSESRVAGIPNSDAQALYEQGYGEFLQRDYPAAETAFHKLVEGYPHDPLAGNAQYWLGETYYVRGQYKKAADTFLTGYRTYGSSDKAPDTLLKLGMSLAALGQKDPACSTFSELAAKFPDAPQDIRAQAKGESRKAGC